MTIDVSILILISLPVFYFDIRYKKIPNIVSLGAWIVAAVAVGINIGSFPDRYFIFSFVSFFSYILIYIISGRRLGLGDVKLSLSLGGISGIIGWYFTNLFASLLGLIFFIIMRLLKRYNANTKIPFGPFLCTGAILNQIIMR